MAHYDVVVLGAGSAGENIAMTLAQEGRSVAVVTDGLVGGECPFVACMPSKAMLRSGEVRHLLGRVTELGAMQDGAHPTRPDKGFARAVERRDEIVEHRDDRAHADELRETGVTLVRARGAIAEPGVVQAGDAQLSYDDVVIATGAAEVRPPIDGLDDVPTWTSADAWSTTERPDSLLVVGGGPVGCEIAQLYTRFGVDVTLVEREEQLAGSEPPEIADLLAGFLRDEGVDVLTGTMIERVTAVDGGVAAHAADGRTLHGARVVLATGVTPRVHDIGLERVGIDPDDGLELDDRGRVVGAPHVWAAGDVTMIAPFTHVANYQARVIADNLLGHDTRAHYGAIPRTMYTDPPVVGVGLTPARAVDGYADVAVGRADLADLPRTLVQGARPGALVLVGDVERQMLVGASAIGDMADAWIHEAVLAVRAQVPVPVLRDTIHAFPTYAEAYDVALAELSAAMGGR